MYIKNFKIIFNQNYYILLYSNLCSRFFSVKNKIERKEYVKLIVKLIYL